LECYERARAIYREMGDRTSECMVLGNLSIIHIELGDLESAEREAKTALGVIRETGAVQFRIGSEISLALNYVRAGRNAEAWTWTRQAMASALEFNEPLFYGPFLLGLLKLRKGDRATGLAWIGFGMANESEFKKEMTRDFARHRAEIYGAAPEAEVEAAMSAGERLSMKEIAEAAEHEEVGA
ncbi:MAG TPA: tetratricopeptide repeat protein, partial [Candidatus Eisenbacteria bacterium]|nr:tetratricopeptide repeat protein [Candidatus Eisenbacteria bacterium]